ncbi:MAG: UvrD-helicase domain-containing protein [Acidothermaceae bacterium]
MSSAAADTRPRYGALAIAEALGQHAPTREQAAVIESTAPSCLVVAGAGSGKTETMAARVVWLVANEFVRPDQVLGLTFTRKAAAELAARVRRRLAQLARHGLVDADTIAAGEPTVSTYDAYAGRIVTEHALRLGREPGQRLISQTVAWQYARRAVDAYDGPMQHVLVQPSTVTSDVLALAEGLAQHRVEGEALRDYCENLHGVLSALPRAQTQRGKKAMPDDLAAVANALTARCELLPIVDAYRNTKRNAEVLDFADQMALAAELADTFADVAAGERATFRAVLLDEYQDTSHAQLVFLRALFGPVHKLAKDGAAPWLTAVGDPSQAIYGWRGASQGTLAAFPLHFKDSGTAEPAQVLNLGTSFRNGPNILAVANEVAAPLREGAASTPVLSAVASAAPGDVRCGLYATIDDEATAVADLVAEVWHGDAQRRADGDQPRSIAVLVRAWRQLPRIESELRARDVPLEILGVGGLLLEPEVVDVVATLRVLADPSRGDALMRLLTGARWRIGPRDVSALGRWARHLLKPRAEAPAAAPTAAIAAEPEPDEVDERSIIDALDELPPSNWLSPDGHARMARLAGELRALRARLAQPLPDLVADVIRTTGLDVEVLAGGPWSTAGRANLDRLVEVAADFTEAGDAASQAGLPAFLDYLDAAAAEERGLERADDDAAVPESRLGVEVRTDRVQLLTVHGAKGLEWDVVCVPGLVADLFPGVRPADVKGWLTQRGALPWPLRGDRAGLPAAALDASADQVDALDAITAFKADVHEHLSKEERRLAYVAVTRARQLLVCTGYRWDDTTKPRADSEFLVAVRDACDAGAGAVDCWIPIPPDTDSNPVLEGGKARLPWPYDPLATRRGAVEAAAALVNSIAAATDQGDLGVAGSAALDPAVVEAMREWDRDVEVLLTERAAREQRARLDVALPKRLSVSQLVTLRRDPDELARQLRRPMPMPPAPLARRGTAFHAWLEQRFSSQRLLDIDELPGSADPDAAPDSEFLALQQAFLASPWTDRDPVEVEVPFELTVGDTIVRGRMDAVFAGDDGGFMVVDWKTGRRPSGDDARAAAVQLAAYRLAWADLTGVELDRIRAMFVYLRETPERRDYSPSDLLDREGLRQLVQGGPE